MATLYYNGTIYTMAAPNDTVEAVLINDGLVTETGSYETLKAQADHFVDLQGQTMML